MSTYKKTIIHVDVNNEPSKLNEKVSEVWGQAVAYHIHNLGEADFDSVYENLAEYLGTIRMCHSANDKSTKFSKSRDIKFDSSLYHYFASNTRQPLHTDYAYYERKDSPDWLMLFCKGVSEFGGRTHILSVNKLKCILEKYNPELLKKIKTNVTWKYNGIDGDVLHTKPILDGDTINWNYWQIKEEHNSEEVMEIRQEFFDFMENFIVAGAIYDFSKDWSIGDCIIFNDHYALHSRDAFLGNERWLKDFAFFEKK